MITITKKIENYITVSSDKTILQSSFSVGKTKDEKNILITLYVTPALNKENLQIGQVVLTSKNFKKFIKGLKDFT